MDDSRCFSFVLFPKGFEIYKYDPTCLEESKKVPIRVLFELEYVDLDFEGTDVHAITSSSSGSGKHTPIFSYLLRMSAYAPRQINEELRLR